MCFHMQQEFDEVRDGYEYSTCLLCGETIIKYHDTGTGG